MRRVASTALARERIAGLAADTLGPSGLLHEVSTVVQKVVPFDLGGLVLLDPDTLVPNLRQPIMHSHDLCAALVRNEVVTPDLNKFSELARRRRATAVLSDAERFARTASMRRHTVLDPAGLGDELRVVFRANGTAWGGGFAIREAGSRPFTPEDRRFLEEIAADVGRGLVESLARATSSSAFEHPESGVVVLDRNLRRVAASGAAHAWLALMPPEALIAMNGIALRAQSPDGDVAAAARAWVHLTNGGWLQLRAARLAAGAGGEPTIAITFSPACAQELTQLVLRLHGLSARERDVVGALLAGSSTADAAKRLYISGHTLRDHVKSIFSKLGVSSRPELMAVLTGLRPREAFISSG